MARPSEGSAAWAGLSVYVIAYDAWALLRGRETLSSAYFRALQSPRRRWPTIALWALLSAHLFRLIPERFDPLRAPISATPPGRRP